jgi:hypothetical protein
MAKSIWIVVIGLMVALGLLAIPFALNAPAVPIPERERELAGKTVVVLLKYDQKQCHVNALEGAQVKRLGDVPFLTGKVVGASRELAWKKGSRLWLPLHEITQIVEYASLDEARKSVTLSE